MTLKVYKEERTKKGNEKQYKKIILRPISGYYLDQKVLGSTSCFLVRLPYLLLTYPNFWRSLIFVRGLSVN